MENYIKLPLITLFLIVYFSIASQDISAQGIFKVKSDIPLTKIDNAGNTIKLLRPWQGGFNGVVVSDLQLSPQNQLLIFDKDANQAFVFSRNTIDQQYDIDFLTTYQLPENINNWIFGLKERDESYLFVYDQSAPKIYQWKTTENNWELINQEVGTIGFSSETNLNINALDLPSVSDVTGDGLSDILVFNFSVGNRIDFNESQGPYSNKSVFDRKDRYYGKIEDCDCNDVVVDQPCGGNGRGILHAGGKTLLVNDLTGNGLPDGLFGDETCDDLNYLINSGDITTPSFSVVESPFDSPKGFASAFQTTDFLFTSTNTEFEETTTIDLSQSVFQYERTRGVDGLFSYSLLKKNFLQDQTLDLGLNAVPSFDDTDRDGDQDLWIVAENLGQSTLYFSENTGTISDPNFILKQNSFQEINSQRFSNARIQWVDYDQNGQKDLFLTANFDGFTPSRRIETKVFLNPNTTLTTFERTINLGNIFTFGNYPYYVDIDQDGKIDQLVSQLVGNIIYNRNIGSSPLNPMFEEVTDRYLGIEPDIFSRMKNILIHDFNQDGQRDLVFSDRGGNAFVVKNAIDSKVDFESAKKKIQIAIEDPMEEMGAEKLHDIRLDLRSYLSVVDIDNNGELEFAVGTARGGISWYNAQETKTTKQEEEGGLISVAFNFLAKSQEIRVTTSIAGKIELLDVLGKRIKEWVFEQSVSNLDLRTTDLSTGLYFLRFVSDQDKKQTIRIFVYD